MFRLCLCVVAIAACQASSPIASEDDAAKIVIQELSCEATLLDTTVKAALSRNGEIVPLHYWPDHGRFYDPEGFSVSLRESGYGVVIVLYEVSPLEQRALQVFNDPLCNSDLETLILQEIASFQDRLDQYACAIGTIESLMEKQRLDPNCDTDCWNTLKERKARIYEGYEYYQEELEPIERMVNAFFSACD